MLLHDDVRTLLDELAPEPPISLEGDWEAVLAEAGERRSRRRSVIVAFAIAGLLLVGGPAVALRLDPVRLFGGAPAPAPVQEAVSNVPGVGSARAYVELRTSVGARVTLFSVEGDRGRCRGLAWQRTGVRDDITMVCPGEGAQAVGVEESGRRVRGGWVALVWGEVAGDVARLELVSEAGAVVPVPLSAAHFLVEVPKWAGNASVVARGVGGLELWRHRLETPPSWVPPDPVEPRRAVAVRVFANRTWSLFSYEARGGRRCFGVETTFASGSPPPWNRAGGDSFRCVGAAEVGALSVLGPDLWPSVRGSGAVVSVSGVVTADVQRVEIELADGSTRGVPVVREAFLYLGGPGAPPPVRAIVYGADGVVLAAEGLR